MSPHAISIANTLVLGVLRLSATVAVTSQVPLAPASLAGLTAREALACKYATTDQEKGGGSNQV